MLLEVGLISLFIIANGAFSMAEMAVVASRKSHIRHLSEQGEPSAALLHHLQNRPEQFLSMIQIGVTLTGATAATLGGVFAVEAVEPFFERFPLLRPWGEGVAVTVVIFGISYLSIVFGELIPKSLALKYPDQIALGLARPLSCLSRVLAPVMRILTRSTQIFLRSVGKNVMPGTLVSEEEIKFLIREGRERGIFNQTEQDLIHSVFEFNDISVKEVMIPRPKVQAISVDIAPHDLLKEVMRYKSSRYPVYREALNNIVGILYFKDVMDTLIREEKIDLQKMIRPAYFVPETMKIGFLLRELQRRRIQMAIVVNEYGSVEGLVTMEDLIEEIVGEIQDEHDLERRPVEQLADGSLVIDASLAIRDLNQDYALSIPESPHYETLGGFLLFHLQSMPKGGDIVQHEGRKYTVVDIEGRRIARAKVEEVAQASVDTVAAA